MPKTKRTFPHIFMSLGNPADVVRSIQGVSLDVDLQNDDGLTFLATAERAMGGSVAPADQPAPDIPTAAPFARPDQPTSFANGRYQVKILLGEGRK